jgi:hypothetical protein
LVVTGVDLGLKLASSFPPTGFLSVISFLCPRLRFV